mmetsp:Transcript_8811/g.18770  ORF Transcript_8811/g.18770 Transcript_8811/m.18770 type:complete len:246 (-) Transcript_8811:117-854(-)
MESVRFLFRGGGMSSFTGVGPAPATASRQPLASMAAASNPPGVATIDDSLPQASPPDVTISDSSNPFDITTSDDNPPPMPQAGLAAPSLALNASGTSKPSGRPTSGGRGEPPPLPCSPPDVLGTKQPVEQSTSPTGESRGQGPKLGGGKGVCGRALLDKLSERTGSTSWERLGLAPAVPADGSTAKHDGSGALEATGDGAAAPERWSTNTSMSPSSLQWLWSAAGDEDKISAAASPRPSAARRGP